MMEAGIGVYQGQLPAEGFVIMRGVFDDQELDTLRVETDRIARQEQSTCVRHLRQKSRLLYDLAEAKKLLELLPAGLSPVRSILFDKTAAANWPVTWHQDLTIVVTEKVALDGYGPWSLKDGSIHVQPPDALLRRMVTARIHLDPTPESNGALHVIPHIPERGKMPSGEVAAYAADQSHVVCACEPGDVLLMSPLLLHASFRAEYPGRRRVIHFEYAPLDALDPRLSWHELKMEPPGG